MAVAKTFLALTCVAVVARASVFGNAVVERTGRVEGKPKSTFVDFRQCVPAASVVTQVHYYVTRPLPTNLSIVFWRPQSSPTTWMRVGATPVLETRSYGNYTRVLTKPIILSVGDCLGWQRDGQGVVPYSNVAVDHVQLRTYSARTTMDGQTVSLNQKKKKLYSFAASYTNLSSMGNPVVTNTHDDNNERAIYVETRSCVSAPSVVVEVKYYVKTPRPTTRLRIVFWRSVGQSRWKRVAATPILNTSFIGAQTSVLETPISLIAGDCLGWQREGLGAIARSQTSSLNRAQFKSSAVSSSNGQEFVFTQWSKSVYSIAARYVDASAWPTLPPTTPPTAASTGFPTVQPTTAPTVTPSLLPTSVPSVANQPCANVYFMVDSSESIRWFPVGKSEWDYIKEFVINVTLEMPVWPYTPEIGAILFGSTPTYLAGAQPRLKTNAADVLRKQFPATTQGVTNLGAALKAFINGNDTFGPLPGLLPDAPSGRAKWLFIVTDGNPSDETCKYASQLRLSGVQVSVFGVRNPRSGTSTGFSLTNPRLTCLASTLNGRKLMFGSDSFAGLSKLTDVASSLICNAPSNSTSSPAPATSQKPVLAEETTEGNQEEDGVHLQDAYFE